MSLGKEFSHLELNCLSLEDLSELNRRVVATIKSKRLLVGKDNATSLIIGATVKVNSPKVAGDDFTVKKINKTKAILTHEKTKVNYTVPFNMIVI